MNNIVIKPAGTLIAKAVSLNKFYSSFLFRVISFLIWFLGIAAFFAIPANFFLMPLDRNFGFVFIAFAVFLSYLAGRTFFKNRVKSPSRDVLIQAKEAIANGKEANLFNALSFESAEVMAKLFSTKKLEEITLHQFGSLLVNASDMIFIMLRLGLSTEEFTGSLEETPINEGLISRALDLAIENNHDSIWSGDLLIALYEQSPGLKELLHNLRIEAPDLRSILDWQAKVKKSRKQEEGFFNPNNLKFTGGIGKDWAYGYTNFLRFYSIDLTQTLQNYGLGIEIIGHENEINEIKSALSKGSSASAIVVGNAGVGKHTTILGFAKKVLDGEMDDTLAHNTIYQVDTQALLAGNADESEITNRFSRVMQEATSAGNVIIVIENIDNLFAYKGVGTADLTAVLLPFLDNSSIHIIGTSEIEPYNQFILSNASLAQRFVRVTVEEPTPEDMIKILEDAAPVIEYRAKSILSFEAIKAAIRMADKYMVNLTDPERTLGLLEGAATKAQTERGQTIILAKDIDEYISEKYAVPTGEASPEEKDKLLNLEQIMHESVIGQDEAIKAVANAMRRARSEVTDSKKPIGSFLFLGPTGVGKTATAKALARAYFGAAENLIRFDMSEYQNSADIYRLIGTGDQPGNLTTFVSEKPFSLLLFDEIEKAYPDILNLFLQILDEGSLTDGRGQKILFSNTIIIATSNAGAELIREAIASGDDYEQVKKSLSDYLISKNLFKPELLNRFTGVVAFSPLSLPEISQVANLMLASLQRTVSTNKGINVTVAADAIPVLSEQGYDPRMGARPMERVIQEKIENLLADKILKGELKKGDSFTVTKEMII